MSGVKMMRLQRGDYSLFQTRHWRPEFEGIEDYRWSCDLFPLGEKTLDVDVLSAI
jgi:hypothetical protein